MAGPQAKARPPAAWLRPLAFLAALAPGPAAAGAWIAPEKGQEIWTSAIGMRGEDKVRFTETSAYFEQPFSERFAIVATPWWEQAVDVGEEGWRAEATLALKTAVVRRERTAVAVQAGAVWNSWPSFDCPESGVELRVLGGRSIGATGFVNAELAGRSFGGGACDGTRLDLTAGYRPDERWLAMGQVFMDGFGGEDGDSVKAQVSLVRFGESGRGIQLGLRGRIDDGLAEPALVLGFWMRPGE